MTEKLATFSQEDDISIITLDDGKANVFSPTMIDHVHGCLDKVPTEIGALIIYIKSIKKTYNICKQIVFNGY